VNGPAIFYTMSIVKCSCKYLCYCLNPNAVNGMIILRSGLEIDKKILHALNPVIFTYPNLGYNTKEFYCYIIRSLQKVLR